MVITGKEGGFVGREGAIEEGLADAIDDGDDEVLVVDAGEDFGGDFVGLEEMVEVGAGVILTTFAVAVCH